MENSAALFDANSPFFYKMLIAGLVVLVGLLLTGFLWDTLYWRIRRKKENKKMGNGTEQERK